MAIKAPLEGEVQQLLALAEEADANNRPDGMRLPEEFKRREDRPVAIAAAKVKIEARAAERVAREQADHEVKRRARGQGAHPRPASRRPDHPH